MSYLCRMKVYIKNMVCPRCISAVKKIAGDCGLIPIDVQLGHCELEGDPDDGAMKRFAEALRSDGFEMLLDAEARLVQTVKDNLVTLLYSGEKAAGINISDYLQDRTHYSYSTLRKVFSSAEGRSIENYYIALRIERVKELIRYEELTLSQIADQLGFSSVAHLSTQFRKVTGLSASEFKNSSSIGRNSIDEI